MTNLAIRAEAVLLSMVYRCADIQEIIDVAASFIDTPIRFSPESNIALSFVSSGYPKEDIEKVRERLSRDDQGFQTLMRTVGITDKHDQPILFRSEDGECEKIFCFIAIGSRYYGNLSIPKVSIPLEDIDTDLIVTIAQILGLTCAVHGVWGYDRSKEKLLKALLLGAIENHVQLAIRAQDWETYNDKQWRLVCVALPKDMPEAILLSGLERTFPGRPAVALENTVSMLVDISEEDINQNHKEMLKTVADKFKTTVLIGPRFDDILACKGMYLSMLAFPQMKKPKPETLVHCDQYRDYSLFWFSALSHDELRKYRNSTVLDIERYDEIHGTAYFCTLRIYLDTGRNIAKTAELLSVHINTVNYRIKRLSELFVLDLSDPNTVFNIMFTFRLMDFLGDRAKVSSAMFSLR
ncbi:MAG: helix-turn-helix domain-containing protein [Raoultibacter sp.]